MLRMSQTRVLSEWENTAFRLLREADLKFPYKKVQLKKFIKSCTLKLTQGKEVIGEYKSIEEIKKRFVNDVKPFV